MVDNPTELLASLAGSLPGLVSADLLEIEQERSMRERLAGRPGTVTQVRLLGPGLTLTLTGGGGPGRRPVAEAARVVRGVVISRKQVPVAEWLDLLAGQLRELAAATATDDASVTRTLAALGVREPASDLVVDAADVPAGLRALPARLAGRIPDDARSAVERICALLLETLPRLDSADLAQNHAVVRTATDYLPRTLREYVALPAGWAAEHQLDGGGTALDALRDQLAVLESAAVKMRDAATRADADQLLANGLFLSDRFGTSEL
jgi:hypothetical protein